MSTESMSTASIIEDRSVLYVNVVIQDASEAIKAGVCQKLEDSNLPPGLKKRLAKHVGKLAADRVSASKIVEKMSPKMVETMPVKMKKKGLTVHAEEVFRDGPYYVIMMQVQHVDAAAMMEAKQLAEKAEKESEEADSVGVRFVKWILSIMGMTLVDSVQKDYLPALIQSKMQLNMGEKMQEEMAEKKMKVSVEVLSEDKQARFFYEMLQQVRETEAAKKEAKKIVPQFSRIGSKKASASTSSTR
jgi:hypothetical protein